MTTPTPTLTISRLDTRYVKVPVSTYVGGVPANLTATAVQMSVVPHKTIPASGDWHTAEWEVAGTAQLIRHLVGPASDLPLAPGTYDVWVKITDTPEIPVTMTGQLVIQ